MIVFSCSSLFLCPLLVVLSSVQCLLYFLTAAQFWSVIGWLQPRAACRFSAPRSFFQPSVLSENLFFFFSPSFRLESFVLRRLSFGCRSTLKTPFPPFHPSCAPLALPPCYLSPLDRIKRIRDPTAPHARLAAPHHATPCHATLNQTKRANPPAKG